MKRLVMSVALATGLLLSGCAGNYYRLRTPDAAPGQYENLGPVQLSATGIHLFGFIPINLNNKIERVMDTGIASKGGDVMTNVVVRERWYWAWVLNIYKVDIEGDVLRRN